MADVARSWSASRTIDWPRRDIPLLLADIERSFDVNALVFQGLRIWPFLRHHLATRLTPATTNAWKRTVTRYLTESNALKQVIRASLGGQVGAYDLLDRSWLANAEAVTNLFVSKSSRTRANQYRGRYFSTLDCVALRLSETETILKAEAFEPATFGCQPPLVPTRYFAYPWRRFGQPDLLRREDVIGPWRGMGLVEQRLGEIRTRYELDFEIDIRAIHAGLGRMKLLTNCFVDMLDALKPRRLFFSHYGADIDSFALCVAAKICGVNAIEVQHGLIGKYCWPNTHWAAIPAEGYEMAPSYTWVWDEATRRDIESSIDHRLGAPKIVVAGLNNTVKMPKTH